MDEEIKSNWVKRTFKVLGIIAAILFVVVVVAFGLIVGICGLAGRR
jgi:hypothetical protein